MKRNPELDILKGFAIFLMVFDHIGWGNAAHTYIQSFHMPLFFIVSGYLWKENRSIYDVVVKKTKSIMVSYASFGCIYLVGLYVAIKLGLTERSFGLALRAVFLFPTDMQHMPFAPALWFLPCFWICNVIYALCGKLRSSKWITIVIISAIGMTYSSLTEWMLPFTLEPVAVGLLFMLIGQLVKQYEELVFKCLNEWWLLILLILGEAILSYLNGSVDMRSARYHNCFFYIIDGTIGTLVWWGIIRKISIRFALLTKIVGYLSINAITFLCTNQFFITMCWFACNRLQMSGKSISLLGEKAIILIITLLLCMLSNEVIMRSKIRIILGKLNKPQKENFFEEKN